MTEVYRIHITSGSSDVGALNRRCSRCWKFIGALPIIGLIQNSQNLTPHPQQLPRIMPTVKFRNEKKSIDVPEGANLRREAMKNGIELYSGPHRYLNCRGNGLCCSCQVHVKNGAENISKPGIWEKLNMWINPLGFFSRIGHEQEVRLACQTKVYGDCEVEARPELNLHGEKFWN